MTKRQLSHWQKQNRIQRITLLGAIIVVVVVLALVGSGLFINQFKPLHETVIKVGDNSYDMDYYIDMLAYFGLTQGTDKIPQMTDYAVQYIQQNRVVVDAAANLDPPVKVSDDEITQAIEEKNLANSASRRDLVEAELLVNKLKTDYFDKQVPITSEYRSLLAMFLESQSQADEIIARINKGEKFQDLAAQLSLESNSKDKSGDFGSLPKDILTINMGDSVLADVAFSSDTKVFELTKHTDPDRSKTLGYWVLKIIETKEESGARQAHVMAMLLGSQEKALDMINQLNNGADFTELAKANSQHFNASTNGGDFGFISKGTLGTAPDAVVFPVDASTALQINKLSQPIKDDTQQTKGGVWLMDVTKIEPDKTLDEDYRSTIITERINQWISEVWTAKQDTVQSFLTDEQKTYAIEKAQAR
jgi:parvulin-like peptidyl-prolyl isomerase